MNTIKCGRDGGFTLMELLITLAIAAMVLAVGVPSFKDFVANQRARTVAQDLLGALTYTRSEAVKRNANIRLALAISSGKLEGWVVTPAATAGTYAGCMSAPDADCLSVHTAADNIEVTTGGVTNIDYQPNGRLPTGTATTTLTICAEGAYQRQVTIQTGGLPEIIVTEVKCS